jgi:2-polyprenyl-6-methoxyphenol hydroxylase-like FAD-dependent oxidoreductase
VGRSAIVVRAGIGGLAVTRGLVESGWRVRVYEQAAAFGAAGAGLAIEPNAVRALDWLGLGQQLRPRGMRQGPAGLRTARGRLLRTRLEELQERFGTPAFALHRADVHQIPAEGLAEHRAVTLHTTSCWRATPPQALLRNDIYTMAAPLPSYRHGRVVLLGDAAHAITPDLGQGAALALEDAVTLAIYAVRRRAASGPRLPSGQRRSVLLDTTNP